MKTGDLCWVYEGAIKVITEPVLFIEHVSYRRGDKLHSYHVVTQSGKKMSFSDYYYSLVPVG